MTRVPSFILCQCCRENVHIRHGCCGESSEATNLGQLRGTVLKSRRRSTGHGLQNIQDPGKRARRVVGRSCDADVTGRSRGRRTRWISYGGENMKTTSLLDPGCCLVGLVARMARPLSGPRKKGAGGLMEGLKLFPIQNGWSGGSRNRTIPLGHLTTPVLQACLESPSECAGGIPRQARWLRGWLDCLTSLLVCTTTPLHPPGLFVCMQGSYPRLPPGRLGYGHVKANGADAIQFVEVP